MDAEEFSACHRNAVPFVELGIDDGVRDARFVFETKEDEALGCARTLSGNHRPRDAGITYTNAATDEIKRRIEFDAFIEVSTIHSFAWSLVSGFDQDIRSWLKENLAHEIAELLIQHQNGRAGTKAATEREHSIEAKLNVWLDSIALVNSATARLATIVAVMLLTMLR